jgi:hypothetical protein
MSLTATVKRTKSGRQLEGLLEICAHRVIWRYWGFGKLRLTQEVIESLELQAEERARFCINDGYEAGQLCGHWDDHEVFGWWEIE